MNRRAIAFVALALIACDEEKPSVSTVVEPTEKNRRLKPAWDAAPLPSVGSSEMIAACASMPFAPSSTVPEASGATFLNEDTLMVVGDSGQNGAYVLLRADSGAELASGRLPLDQKASDDLEGLARVGDTLYAITSSGWMREWSILRGEKTGFRLSGSYALAPAGSDLSCKSHRDTNCGQNYEGLCLLPNSTEGCVGFAAAKETGRLICLRRQPNGSLALDGDFTIDLGLPKALSGCHFDVKERLWFGSNAFAANAVGRLDKWREESTFVRFAPQGIGFMEAIAVAQDGLVFRFSDTAEAPSLLVKADCR